MNGFFTLFVKMLRGLNPKTGMIRNVTRVPVCVTSTINSYTYNTNDDVKQFNASFILYPVPFLMKSVPVLIKIVI